jgi:hypothetical protein
MQIARGSDSRRKEELFLERTPRMISSQKLKARLGVGKAKILVTQALNFLSLQSAATIMGNFGERRPLGHKSD